MAEVKATREDSLTLTSFRAGRGLVNLQGVSSSGFAASRQTAAEVRSESAAAVRGGVVQSAPHDLPVLVKRSGRALRDQFWHGWARTLSDVRVRRLWKLNRSRADARMHREVNGCCDISPLPTSVDLSRSRPSTGPEIVS